MLCVLVAHFVDGDGHVSRLRRTGVHVTVVLGDQIDVVEDEALERVLLQRLDERDVHYTSFVERVLAVLHRTMRCDTIRDASLTCARKPT